MLIQDTQQTLEIFVWWEKDLVKLADYTKRDTKCTDERRKEGKKKNLTERKKKPKERGGVAGWPVILSPSGTHMKHDGRMRGGIFHCQSEGGMVIHFFLSYPQQLSLSALLYCSSLFSLFWTPRTHRRNNDNLIILPVRACRGRELPNQPIVRGSPHGESPTEKVQKTDKSFEPASFSPFSLTHAHTHTHTEHLSI